MKRKRREDSGLICGCCGFVWFSPPPEPFIQVSGIPAGYVIERRFAPVDMHKRERGSASGWR